MWSPRVKGTERRTTFPTEVRSIDGDQRKEPDPNIPRPLFGDLKGVGRDKGRTDGGERRERERDLVNGS